MNITTKRTALTFAALLAGGLALAGCSSTADAETDTSATETATQAESLSIVDPWVKSAESGMSAAFGTIENDSDQDANVVAAATEVSPMIELQKAGVFNHEDGPLGSEVLVRPAQQGSFLIEVVRVVQENPGVVATVGAVVGLPTLSQVIWWATRSARAEVSNYEHQDNGKVKVEWQDNTVDEIPVEAWNELQKRSPRRKKHLRQILAPLGDSRVSSVNVVSAGEDDPTETEDPSISDASKSFVLEKPDYDAVAPSDDVEQTDDLFEVEAQMSAIDFDNPSKWRVKTKTKTRGAQVEDMAFLARVADGMAIRKSDIFRLKIREDTVKKNGRSRSTWTVLRVESHRRAADDDES